MEDRKGFNRFLADNEKAQQAFVIAQAAHDGQMRKWTKTPEPYISHPRRVAERAYNYLITCNRKDEDDLNVVCAALLHDVIEDTAFPPYKIKEMFSDDVYNLVVELTDPPFPEGMPRDHKFGITVKKWHSLSPLASLIKLADRLDNLGDANQAPKRWLEKYLVESSILAAILGPRWPHMGRELEEKILKLGP